MQRMKCKLWCLNRQCVIVIILKQERKYCRVNLMKTYRTTRQEDRVEQSLRDEGVTGQVANQVTGQMSHSLCQPAADFLSSKAPKGGFYPSTVIFQSIQILGFPEITQGKPKMECFVFSWSVNRASHTVMNLKSVTLHLRQMKKKTQFKWASGQLVFTRPLSCQSFDYLYFFEILDNGACSGK